MVKKKYKFKKGQTVHLDSVYEILGIIPLSTYNQDDPGNTGYSDSDNDSGETLKFIKNVDISINVKVT